MPTAQQLLGLIKSHALGDEERFRALTLQLAASEERRGHTKLAEELRELANKRLSEPNQAQQGTKPVPLARPRGELADLMSASYPKDRISDLVLPKQTSEQLRTIVHEQRQRWRLREHGLFPRQKLLLIGPPGSGKTMTAASLAGELGLPLFTILLHGLITKFMGETAAKMRLVFDAISSTRGVYLFDEVDALAAQRNATNDVGEARRILNSFLHFLDQDESESIIVATTNHPELLDRAVFRRFHITIEYRFPEKPLVIQTIKARIPQFDTTSIDWTKVSSAGLGLSNADLIRAAEDAARLAVLSDRRVLGTSDLVTALSQRRPSIVSRRNGTKKRPSSHRSTQRRSR